MTCRNGSHYECEKGCHWLNTCEERKSFLVEQLVRSVIDWADVDDAVATNGWDGDNEERWSELRRDMLDYAKQLEEMAI